MSNNFQLILKSANYEVNALTERPGAARPLRPRPDARDDEEIRPLVNSLRFGRESRGAPRSIMVASVEASGHSASVCLRVARALASSDTDTVCLVDANLSDPSMHRTFGVPRDPGVAEVLQDARSHIVPGEVEPGLWLLPAGSGPLGPAGLSLDRVTAMTDELASSFDWVLADIGPIEAGGRTAAMAGCADGVVLVVAANATRRAVALKVKEDIVAAGGRVLGAVLAERTFPIPEVIYRRL